MYQLNALSTTFNNLFVELYDDWGTLCQASRYWGWMLLYMGCFNWGVVLKIVHLVDDDFCIKFITLKDNGRDF